MKTKMFLKAFIVLFIPVLYYLLNSGFRSVTEGTSAAVLTSGSKNFENYILNGSSEDPNDAWCMEKFVYPYNYYDELNYTGVHIYDDWDGGNRLGNFSNPVLETTQINNIRSIISIAKNNGLKTMFERINISRLCYSQRLVYEVSDGGSQTVNNGFCWQQCSGDYIENDQGRTVLHKDPNADNTPVYLCSNIYENLMHTDLGYFNAGLGDNGTWHVKPVMKIRQEDFNNPAKRDLPVVIVDIKNYAGTVIKSITIHVWNFRNNNGQYTEGYKDIYTFELGTDSLAVSGSTNGGLGQGWHKAWYWDCAVDFKVYWPGNIEVWFDKMVVDDDGANKLLAATNNYNDKIEDELNQLVKNAPDDSKLDLFFADECSYSNISSIKYVQNFIKSYNQSNGTNARLVYATSNALNYASRRNHDNSYILGLDSTQPQNLTPLLVFSPTTKTPISLLHQPQGFFIKPL